MHRIECDKCGRNDLTVTRPERSKVTVSLPTKTLNLDFCESCLPRVERWLTERDPQEKAA